MNKEPELKDTIKKWKLEDLGIYMEVQFFTLGPLNEKYRKNK